MAKVVFAEMQRQGVTYDTLEWDAGVLRSTFKAWRTNNRPGLDTIEAALGALGWAVLPVPRLDRLPDELQGELNRLAERWGEINPLICQLLATVSKVPIMAKEAVAAVKVRKVREPNPNQDSIFKEIAL